MICKAAFILILKRELAESNIVNHSVEQDKVLMTSDVCIRERPCPRQGAHPRGGTPYSGLYGEAPPERDTFFRLQVYKRVGISQAEVYKRVGKSVI